MNHKSKSVFGLSKLTPTQKVVKVQSVKDAMQTHGSSADTSVMHEEERVLVMACNLIKAHVDIIANTLSNPEAVILAIGLSVASSAGRYAVTDLTLDAIGGGTVQIRVPRTTADKAFIYQYALDSDPTNWQSIGFNSLSKIEFKNQMPGSIIHVRYAPIGKSGAGAYSSSKHIMVV